MMDRRCSFFVVTRGNPVDKSKRICLPKPFTLAEFHAAIGKVLASP